MDYVGAKAKLWAVGALAQWLAALRLKANVEHELDYCEPLTTDATCAQLGAGLQSLNNMHDAALDTLCVVVRTKNEHLVQRVVHAWRLAVSRLSVVKKAPSGRKPPSAKHTLGALLDRSAHYTALGHQLGRQMCNIAIQMWKTKQRHSQQLKEEAMKISELLELHTIQAQRCEQLQLKVVINKEKASIRLHVHMIVAQARMYFSHWRSEVYSGKREDLLRVSVLQLETAGAELQRLLEVSVKQLQTVTIANGTNSSQNESVAIQKLTFHQNA